MLVYLLVFDGFFRQVLSTLGLIQPFSAFKEFKLVFFLSRYYQYYSAQQLHFFRIKQHLCALFLLVP